MPMAERATARIDLGAITRNCRRLAEELVGGAMLGVVVKADGYGHGAREAAAAALAGGAERLFVATAREARDLGTQRVPVAVMGALSPEELAVALEAGAEVTAWEPAFAAGLPAGTGVLGGGGGVAGWGAGLRRGAARRHRRARQARHGHGPARHALGRAGNGD